MNDEGRAFLDAALPHLDVVYRVARYASKDHHRAEDLVQETYLRGYAAFGSHRGPSTKAWLGHDLPQPGSQRRPAPGAPASRNPLPPLHDPEAPGVNVPEAALANIDRGSVSRALSRLPEDQRTGYRPDGPGRPQRVGGGRHARLPSQHGFVACSSGPQTPGVVAHRGRRQPMSCNEDRIIAFLAGELSDEDERRFDGHLLQCEECWRAVQADRTARFALEKLRAPAPAGLQDMVALAVTWPLAEASPNEGPLAGRLTYRYGRPWPGRWYGSWPQPACSLPWPPAAVAWLEARGGPADPPQVAAVAAMMTPGSSPAKALRAGEHMVIAGQGLAVRAYVMDGNETIVATSARPFSVPQARTSCPGRHRQRGWRPKAGSPCTGSIVPGASNRCSSYR